jgi:hypothetical protein
MKRRPNRSTAVREIENDEIPPLYDFSKARRNPYAARIPKDSIMVSLDPDVAKDFPDADSVNKALRALSAIIKRQTKSRRSA